MKTPEVKVKQIIDKELDKWAPDVDYRKVVRMSMGDNMLDYHGCAWGRFFAIEAKRFGKKPTTLQKITAEELRAAGGKVFTVTGADENNDSVVGLEEVIMWFTQIKNGE